MIPDNSSEDVAALGHADVAIRLIGSF